MLEVKVLGGLKISLSGEDITERLSGKAAALLVYLACNSGRMLAKDKLATYFWEDSDMYAAKNNLRHNLWILKRVLMISRKEMLHISKEFCGISDKETVYIDAGEFNIKYENLLSDNCEQLEMLKSIYQGDFLDGVYLKNCIDYNDWIFFERENLQKKYFDVLHRLKQFYFSKGKYIKQIELLSEMLQINPLKEDLYVEQIKSYLLLEDWGKAREKYIACTDMLHNELNESPGDKLKELGQQIRERKRLLPARENQILPISFSNFDGPDYSLPAFIAEKIIGELSEGEKREKEKLLDDLSCLTAKWIPKHDIYFRPNDIKIYSSITDLLSMLSEREMIKIQIENSDCMDEKSRQFMAFLLSHLQERSTICINIC